MLGEGGGAEAWGSSGTMLEAQGSARELRGRGARVEQGRNRGCSNPATEHLPSAHLPLPAAPDQPSPGSTPPSMASTAGFTLPRTFPLQGPRVPAHLLCGCGHNSGPSRQCLAAAPLSQIGPGTAPQSCTSPAQLYHVE